jgi:hypothetical protein
VVLALVTVLALVANQPARGTAFVRVNHAVWATRLPAHVSGLAVCDLPTAAAGCPRFEQPVTGLAWRASNGAVLLRWAPLSGACGKAGSRKPIELRTAEGLGLLSGHLEKSGQPVIAAGSVLPVDPKTLTCLSARGSRVRAASGPVVP